MTGRRPTRRRDDGAILLFVLVIVTLLAAATAALAEFGFDSPHAAAAQVTHQRIVNALDDGLQAAVENTRLGASAPCNGTALSIADVDGPGGSSAASPAPRPPITATVTCVPPAAPGGTYAFIATESIDASTCLSARATVTGQSATVTSWAIGTLTNPTTCTERP
jgi:hypothetical protein